MFLLHGVGASRCPAGAADCTASCSQEGTSDGKPLTKKTQQAASPANSPKKGRLFS